MCKAADILERATHLADSEYAEFWAAILRFVAVSGLGFRAIRSGGPPDAVLHSGSLRRSHAY